MDAICRAASLRSVRTGPRRGPRNLRVRRPLGLGGANGGVAERRHGPGELLKGGVHPLEAVAEGEEVGGDRPKVVSLEEGVDLARVHRLGGLRRHRSGSCATLVRDATGTSSAPDSGLYSPTMVTRDIRYQAAVVRDGGILIVQVALADGRRLWLLPGGGREPEDRSAESCVEREVREETGLEVVVDRLLIAAPAHPDDETYQHVHTYLCRPSSGEAASGAADGTATVSAVRWLAIDAEWSWGDEIRGDRFLYPQLARIRETIRRTPDPDRPTE